MSESGHISSRADRFVKQMMDRRPAPERKTVVEEPREIAMMTSLEEVRAARQRIKGLKGD